MHDNGMDRASRHRHTEREDRIAVLINILLSTQYIPHGDLPWNAISIPGQKDTFAGKDRMVRFAFDKNTPGIENHGCTGIGRSGHACTF